MKNAIPNSANSANQPPETGKRGDIYARTRPRRKITEATIEAVAALVSRGMTATEACHQINVRPKTFFNFTSLHRNDTRFKELLERFTAMRVDDLLAEIEKSARGEGMKQRDWRAAQFLLQVLDRQRFNPSAPAPAPQVQTPMQINVLMKCIDRIYGAEPVPVKVTDITPPKQLPAPSDTLPATFDNE